MRCLHWVLTVTLGAAACLSAGCSDTPAGAASPPNEPVRGAPLINVGVSKGPAKAAPDGGANLIPGAPDAAALAGPMAPGATKSAPKIEAPTRDGYQSVTFDQLASFRFPTFLPQPGDPVEDDPNGAATTEIPAEIDALNGRKVVVAGFMVPIEMRNGKVRTFLLVRNQLACCFGMPMGLTEWLDITVDGDGLEPVQDVLVAVSGTLDVGPKVTEDGMVLSLYRMKADSLRPLDGF